MISIFTPTYNRAHMLPALKNCIDEQTDRDFEWIIVDDGSVDDTKKLVDVWMKQERLYSLKYIYQDNQGKHIASNTAIKIAKGDWFICVDSDDQITAEAVATMNNDIKNVPDGCVGIVYPRQLKGFDKETEWKLIDGKKVDIMDLKVEYKIPESAILIRNSEISDLHFPKIEGEKFIPEGWIYQKLIERGKFWAQNKIFYWAEYQDDGLTKNVWKLWAQNSTGVLMVLREKYAVLNKYRKKTRIIEKVKCAINANTICMASNKRILKNAPSKALGVILYVPSMFFYHKRFNEKLKEDV